MKLNIGDNIRSNRKKADMTQEQLAEKLGVSYQSVSRWENSSSYPDMEFLPAIAKFFKVSVDELLGMPDEKKEQEAKEAFTNLAKATYEEPVDTEKINNLIRDIRRNHLESNHFWHFWSSTKQSVYRMPEVLPEVRLTAETILDGKSSMFEKNRAIEYMSKLEDDEHIEKFLELYASELDLTKKNLLNDRYRFRGEWDKAESLRQLYLYIYIDQLIGNSGMWKDYNKDQNLNELISVSNLELSLLHQLCGQVPDEKHPISGTGEVDFWVEPRMWMGMRKACCLAGTSDSDGAFAVLEDTVSLLEKAMKITQSVELRCTSPWLGSMVWKAEESWIDSSFASPAMAMQEERSIWIHNYEGYCYFLHPSWYRDILTGMGGWKGWEWFDSIRSDPRYQGYVERLNTLVITRPKKDA